MSHAGKGTLNYTLHGLCMNYMHELKGGRLAVRYTLYGIKEKQRNWKQFRRLPERRQTSAAMQLNCT